MSAWIPLMDYAIKKSVSISTLRRYIKSNKIKYRTENGKYMLWDDEAGAQFIASSGASANALLMPSFSTLTGDASLSVNSSSPSQMSFGVQPESSQIQKLELALQNAQEEISELKMLVSLYEDQLHPKSRSL
jgi:hypothetical protein